MGNPVKSIAADLLQKGVIDNRMGLVREAFGSFREAFELDPRVARLVVPEEHKHHNYEYKLVLDDLKGNCPFCGKRGNPKWTFACITNHDFNPGFNPYRMWMYCEDCNHIWAYNYPENYLKAVRDNVDEQYLGVRGGLVPVAARIFYQISQLMYKFVSKPLGRSELRLLDVGVGGGEFALVAKEMGYDVTGIDIRKSYVDKLKDMIGMEVYQADFMEYDGGPFDIICMGDVIEHYHDPVAMLGKAYNMLGEAGILWISTPNFESAFSQLYGLGDAMKRVVEHLHYFSYKSLRDLLKKAGFGILDYRISEHYAGCMEITAYKGVEDADIGDETAGKTGLHPAEQGVGTGGNGTDEDDRGLAGM